MIFSGVCYPSCSSVKYDAQLEILPEHRVKISSDLGLQEQPLADMEISEPLGKLPIKLIFPDGMQFIPHQSNMLEDALQAVKPARLHKLERNVPLVLASLIALILACVVFFTDGIPWTTTLVAKWMPSQVSDVVGKQVLDSLDEHVLKPSELSQIQQDEIKQRFEQITSRLPPLPESPKLLFRHWDSGPNAFALSDGTIIVLDDLVRLAETSQQLDSILLHELGHIQHQHVIKSLIHSALLSAFVTVLTGEASALIDTFTGVGVFLITQGYSRSAEQEADAYAANKMKYLYGTVLPMKQMFVLLNGEEPATSSPTWLSTHPDLDLRIEHLSE